MLKLVLTSHIADIWKAATEAPSFAEWISHREGYQVSLLGTFHALLLVRPWDTVGVESAPWRVIRSAMAQLNYE